MAYPIANLGDLTSAIGDWAWRSTDPNFTAAIPQMIANFEASFARRQRTQEMVEEDTITIAAAATTLPSGYLEMIRLQVVDKKYPLTYVSPAEAARFDTTTDASGIIYHYTIIAGQVVLVPQVQAPIGATLEMVYYTFTGLATAPGGVNWLLTKHPDIYLYGSLLQGAAYIDDKDTVAQWKVALDGAMDELALAAKRAKYGASPLVMRPAQFQVFSSRRSTNRPSN